jgi:predicted  nucleic acid-binding Zn-ribbon protein
MSRKKITKRSKKVQKSTKSSVKVSRVQKLEQEFLSAPTKIMAELSKECATLKKQETKIMKTLSKTKTQLNAAEKRIKQATGNKKQLAAAKQQVKDITSLQNSLTKQLHNVSKTLAARMNDQARFAALSKHLTQFNKDWVKQSRKTKAKKLKIKKTKATSSSTMEPSTLGTYDNSMMDNEHHEETTEDTEELMS